MTLRYKKGASTYDITTYATTDELNEYGVDQSHRLCVQESTGLRYAALSNIATYPSHPLITDMRAKVGSTTYSVLSKSSNPIYWSQAENKANLLNPNYGGTSYGTSTITNDPHDYPAGKYGNCARNHGINLPPYSYPGMNRGVFNTYYSYIYPLSVDTTQGSCSFWAKTHTEYQYGTTYVAGSGVFFGGAYSLGITGSYGGFSNYTGSSSGWGVGITTYHGASKICILYGSTVKFSTSVSENVWYSIHVNWDYNRGLANNTEYLNLYVDSIKLFSTTESPPSSSLFFTIACGKRWTTGVGTSYVSEGVSCLDNPKIWKIPKESRVSEIYASETYL